MVDRKIKIIFMGTPDFVVPVFETLVINFNVVAVVTQPDKARGRGKNLQPSPIKLAAQKYKFPVFQPEKISEINSELKSLTPDLFIVAAYGQILPKDILEIPKYGCLNVHASLLPKYRGASPVAAAILTGDKETGVTIIQMEPKMDTGPILAQQRIKIEDTDTTFSLSKKLFELGAKMIKEVIPKWINDEIVAKKQDENTASYCTLIKKEMGKIDWKKPAIQIEKETRAYFPWPTAFTYWKKNNIIKQIKILKAKAVKIKEIKEPGTVLLIPPRELVIACGKEALKILQIQIEGKKPQTTYEFLNGYPDFIGSILK